MIKRKPSPPKFMFGQTIGCVTVLCVLPWVRDQHGRGEYSYKLQCACGEILTRKQDWLRRRGSHKMCNKCLLAARQGRWKGATSEKVNASKGMAKPGYIEPNIRILHALKIMSTSPGRFYNVWSRPVRRPQAKGFYGNNPRRDPRHSWNHSDTLYSSVFGIISRHHANSICTK